MEKTEIRMTTALPQRRRFRRHLSLAGQYLVMQLLIIGIVLTGVIVVSVHQATESFETVESRRSLSAAESLAANGLLRTLLPDAAPEMGAALPAMAESVRSVSGLSVVAIADADGTIVTSSHPAEVGTSILHEGTTVMQGRAWRGVVDHDGTKALQAQVPVLDDGGDMIGVVAAGQTYPSTAEIVRDIAPNALFTLLVCVILGATGSVLLARRVKRQTRGLEPREIAELFDHREALLHGVKEGIIAIGPDGRVSLANDVAKELLHLPDDCLGRTLPELAVEPQVTHALMTAQPDPDRQFLIGEKVLVFNRMSVTSDGLDLGSVTTFRDRTELTLLEQELGDTKATSDMLRAQTHEFANQLHTISGLIQLGHHDDVVGFIDGVSFSRSRIFGDVSSQVSDPTISALLIAKASVAAERGIALNLSANSHLPPCDDPLARDLTTVLGNLVDNAIDAVAGTPTPSITATVRDDRGTITVIVDDNGPGIDDAVIEEIFTQGFSTKDSAVSGGRGFGLALTRLVCNRRFGDVHAVNEDGARFIATLKRDEAMPTDHPAAVPHFDERSTILVDGGSR